MVKRFCNFLFLVYLVVNGYSQERTITVKTEMVSGFLQVLASDSLLGRGNYTPGLVMAAEFITNEFEKHELVPFPGYPSLVQPFTTALQRKFTRDELRWNNELLDQKSFELFTPELVPNAKSLEHFTLIEVSEPLSDSFLYQHWNYNNPVLLWIKKESEKDKGVLYKNVLFPRNLPKKPVLVVAHPQKPDSILVTVNERYLKEVLFNIVGMLPGTKKPNEIIIFSAHYDHIGGQGHKKR
jgi:hypothetical protein